MSLDLFTLLCSLMINLIAIALALPAVMGRVNAPARRAQWAMALVAAGWMTLLASGTAPRGSWSDWLLSTLAMAGLGASFALLGSAFDLWRGRHRHDRRLDIVAVALVLGYSIGFGSYRWRVGWANGLLALQMLLVAAALFRPAPLAAGRWRWPLALALTAQALVTAWRAVLGAFFTASFPAFRAPHPANVASAIVANVTALVTLMAIVLAHRDESARELQRLATIDGLTGVLNRRAWLLRAQEELAAGARHATPIAVLMIDLDHFKKINDSHGHEAGDRALRCVGRALAATARAGDLVGRYGGEEFCVLITHADGATARAYDQRLRETLARLTTAELGFALDYSGGVARAEAAGEPLAALLARADAMLYRAKHEGRGRTLDEQGRRL